MLGLSAQPTGAVGGEKTPADPIERLLFLGGAYKYLWRQDGHPTKRIENQQVVVTAHYAAGISAYRQFEKLVV